MLLTSRQPSNAGGFRRVAFTKPINDRGKQRQEQVNPALRLPAGVMHHLYKQKRTENQEQMHLYKLSLLIIGFQDLLLIFRV